MRVALHTRLRPRREAERAGAPRGAVDLVDAIRGAGVRDWRMWRSGLDLFHVVDVDDNAAMPAARERLPANVAWQARINPLLGVSHDYSPAGADRGLPVVWNLRDA